MSDEERADTEAGEMQVPVDKRPAPSENGNQGEPQPATGSAKALTVETRRDAEIPIELQVLASQSELELQRLAFWRRVHIGVIALFVGTSIGGIWAVKLYLDAEVEKQLSERIEVADEVAIANTQAAGGDWFAAAETFAGVRDKLPKEIEESGEDFRDNVYSAMVWALANIDSQIVADIEKARDHWKLLKDDPVFKKLRGSQGWRDSPQIQEQIAVCTLKYEPSKQALENAMDAISITYHRSRSLEEFSWAAFRLGLLYMISENHESAKLCFSEASQVDPANHRIGDWFLYRMSFVNSSEFRSAGKLFQKIRNCGADDESCSLGFEADGLYLELDKLSDDDREAARCPTSKKFASSTDGQESQ